jgi:hypothetical protein
VICRLHVFRVSALTVRRDGNMPFAGHAGRQPHGQSEHHQTGQAGQSDSDGNGRGDDGGDRHDQQDNADGNVATQVRNRIRAHDASRIGWFDRVISCLAGS